MSYSTKRITTDFRDLNEKDLQKFKIGCGAIDNHAVFQALYNYEPSAREFEAFKAAMKEVRSKLTRCQIDLLIAEFGEENVSINDAVTATDALLCDPLSANLEKLNTALSLIHETANPSLKTARQADAFYARAGKLINRSPKK